MEASFFLALILAFIAPCLWGLSNVLDKFIVSHKVKDAKGFTAVAALVYIIIGLGIGIWLDWSEITLNSLIFPIISGGVLGISLAVYFITVQKEDPSHILGLIYVYPLIVALLSFIFLNENLPIMGYIGVILIIIGALFLSARLKEIKMKKIFWITISIMILCAALHDFFLKIAADNLPILHGLALTEFSAGIFVSLIIFRKDVRKGFFKEINKIKWSFLSESLVFLSIAASYGALMVLPVTFVSGISAIQPLAILFMENWAHNKFGKIRRDHLTKRKAVAISIMVVGIILLYISAPHL